MMSYNSKKLFQCVVCDYTTDTIKGLEIHISKKAKKEEEFEENKINIFNGPIIPFRQQFIV